MRMKEKVILINQETLICTNLSYFKIFFFFLNYSKFFFNNSSQMLNIIKSSNIILKVTKNFNKNLHYFYFYIFLINLVFINNLYNLNMSIALKNILIN